MLSNILPKKKGRLARALTPAPNANYSDDKTAEWIEQARDIIHRPNRSFIRVVESRPTAPTGIVAALQKRFPFLPFDNTVHRRQLAEMLPPEERQRLEVSRRERNRAVVISFVSLCLATAGHALYWPIGLLSIPGVIFVPMPVFKRAYSLLKAGKVGVPTIFTITAVGAVVCGYFWVASFAIFIFSLAYKYIISMTEETRYNLVNIFQDVPDFVWALVDGVEVKTPIADVKVGQIVVINAGEAIPVDGIITEGTATVDQKFLTGEAKPAEKGPGDSVFAATVMLSGRIYVEVEQAGHDTTVARIGQILNNTVDYKSSVQLRAATLADKTVWPMLIAGALTLPFFGPMTALTVISTHFRYKLSFIVPVSLMNFLNMASQRGILIKDGRSLDLLSQVDTVVFDKTGTLTEEQPFVGRVYACDAYDENQVLTYAAAAEYKQTHPIARAILDEAKARELDIPSVSQADYKISYGLTVNIEDKLVQVGSYRFMEMSELCMPAQLTQAQTNCHEQGHSLVLVAVDEVVIGAIELEPTIRAEAKQIITNLKQRHNIKHMYIISGDHETPTRKLAQAVGIPNYFAETLPEAKADIIERLIDEGRFVCYIGDGINDSIALRKSQVSVSMRGASTVAIDTAQIIMMHGNLAELVTMFDYAREFYINTNVSFGIVLVPMFIGLGGVFFLGFGLFHTRILGVSSLLLGIGNSMVPAIRHGLKAKNTQALLSNGTTADLPEAVSTPAST